MNFKFVHYSFINKKGENELCYRCGNIEKCKRERKEKCF